jgi:large subunit ribosomal protein L1
MKSKSYKQAVKSFEQEKKYSLEKALEILEKFPKVKFDESVEMHIRLNVDSSKSDQQVRASVALPHGTGKTKKIAAFTETQQDEAKKAGADIVGGEELVGQILKDKKIDFDVAVATPEMMPKLSKAARILGPRGLMPNPKTGTVGPKVVEMIEELKKGKADFKTDKTGNIHQVIGKRSFSKEQLKENAEMLIETINKNKPTKSKGILIKNITLTATMTPGIKVKNS